MNRDSLRSSGSVLLKAWGITALAAGVLVFFGIWLGPTNLARHQLNAEALVECYQPALSMEEWDIQVWMDSLPDDQGFAVADSIYLDGDIYLDIVTWEELDQRRRRELVIHEMLHLKFWKLLAPLWELDEESASASEETFVTEFSRSPLLMRWRCR
jgi:hypothetical protein